ncbi:MAG: glutaminyl-peptide cyclotransferase [Williamsia sp.]|nr:glutaminyl-peptide cyclotransferase [Williamsia sp.]
MKKIFPFLIAAMAVLSCSNNTDTQSNEGGENAGPPLLGYNVVNIYPHDTSSFTEGLLVHNGQLYESTGGTPSRDNYVSWFGPVDLKSGKAVKKILLDTSYFGEGITILNGKLYQLTWEDQIGFVYDVNTLQKIKEFKYTGEGWALTNDGKSLIMSDGSSNIRYLDPESLQVQKILGVEDNNGPVSNINELEWIHGYIYANIWQTNFIIKIDPANGKVVGKYDLTALYNEAAKKFADANVLNGIAFDSAANKVYVTGKTWPNLYEIKIN